MMYRLIECGSRNGMKRTQGPASTAGLDPGGAVSGELYHLGSPILTLQF